MISFSKFKNKNSFEEEHQRQEPSLRSRQHSVVDEDLAPLSEKPEIQRARQRLIGAVFLLLVAVIGLPRIFDSEPKKIQNDVAIKVISPTAVASPEQATGLVLDKSVASVASEEVISNAARAVPAAPLAQKNNGIAEGETVIAESASNDMTKAKYYLQVATYSSNERVKKMALKLKELQITSYIIERKKESDGSPLYALRAGPFANKEEAQLALKKMADLELSPKIIEIKTAQR